MVADNTARHLASNFCRGRARFWLFSVRWGILGSLEVSLAHVLSGIAVGILSLVLRTVISRGRDDFGAVEKTLKGILTICTVVVFPVVVALSCTNYKGVKQPAVSGSSFAMKLRVIVHQSESIQYGLVRVVHFRKEPYANVVLSGDTICSRRFLSA